MPLRVSFALFFVFSPLFALDKAAFEKEVIAPQSSYNNRISDPLTVRTSDGPRGPGLVLSSMALETLALAMENSPALVARQQELADITLRVRELQKLRAAHFARQKLLPPAPQNPGKAAEAETPRAQILALATYLNVPDDATAQAQLKNRESLLVYRHALWALGGHVNHLLQHTTDVAPPALEARTNLPVLDIQADKTRIAFIKADSAAYSFLEHTLALLRMMQTSLSTSHPQKELVKCSRDWISSIAPTFYNRGAEAKSAAVWLEAVASFSFYIEMSFASRMVNPSQKTLFNPRIVAALEKFYLEFRKFSGELFSFPPSAWVSKDFEVAYRSLMSELGAELAAVDKAAAALSTVDSTAFTEMACRWGVCAQSIGTQRIFDKKIAEGNALFQRCFEEYLEAIAKLPEAYDSYWGRQAANQRAIAIYFVTAALRARLPAPATKTIPTPR